MFNLAYSQNRLSDATQKLSGDELLTVVCFFSILLLIVKIQLFFLITIYLLSNQQLLHLLGFLTDAGKSVMLVGKNSSGKTAIISERIHTVCSGEVAEVLSLTLHANRY